jgi:hypothetical protein
MITFDEVPAAEPLNCSDCFCMKVKKGQARCVKAYFPHTFTLGMHTPTEWKAAIMCEDFDDMRDEK